MAAAISRHNDCPYCEDMLVGLVHGDGDHQSASSLLRGENEEIADGELRERVRWAVSTVDPETDWSGSPPFGEELPEALGSVFAFGYIKRLSHVTMAGSPIQAPLGLDALKRGAVRFFGGELRDVAERSLEPGRALDLVEEAPVPEDLWWAEPNPRVADALARWVGAVQRHAAPELSSATRDLVRAEVRDWEGERMPLSRRWADDAVERLGEDRRQTARESRGEAGLIRVLAWSAMVAVRHLTGLAAERAVAASGEMHAE